MDGWADGQADRRADGRTELSMIVVGAFNIVTLIVNNSLHSATEVRATLADLFWREQLLPLLSDLLL